MNALAPTGTLRFGLAFAPEASTFFVDRDASGAPRGVTVDLALDLAGAIGCPVEFVVAPSTGILTAALVGGSLDAAFMPVDAERRELLGIGPVYFIGQNTYLVRPGADIRTLADVDRPDVRVIGIAGTSTIRSVAALLKNASVEPAASVDAALDMLREGAADAFALTRDTLAPLATRVPGSRILEGAFREVEFAIVVPRERPQALIRVTAWLEAAKASGVVRRAFDAAGFRAAEVAPA